MAPWHGSTQDTTASVNRKSVQHSYTPQPLGPLVARLRDAESHTLLPLLSLFSLCHTPLSHKQHTRVTGRISSVRLQRVRAEKGGGGVGEGALGSNLVFKGVGGLRRSIVNIPETLSTHLLLALT